MKIDKVIFASDDSFYLDYWPHVAEITTKKLNLKPVLFHLTNENTELFFDGNGLVKKIKQIPQIPSSRQAQVYRMYGTKWFPKEVCLISDVDMFLFNKQYLDLNVEAIPNDDLVIVGSDAYDSVRPECIGIYSGPNRYPICYVAGKSETFNLLLNTDVEFEYYFNEVSSYGPLLHCDEMFFGTKVNQQTSINVHKIKRGYCSTFHLPTRIEKFMFNPTNENFKLNIHGKVDFSNYIDCHCPRPFQTYKNQILKIKNDILSSV